MQAEEKKKRNLIVFNFKRLWFYITNLDISNNAIDEELNKLESEIVKCILAKSLSSYVSHRVRLARALLNFEELRARQRARFYIVTTPSVMSRLHGGLVELTRCHKGQGIIASKTYNGSNRVPRHSRLQRATREVERRSTDESSVAEGRKRKT